MSALLIAMLCATAGQSPQPAPAAPLPIGETFTIASRAVNETRRINVYLPPGYDAAKDTRMPVFYMRPTTHAEDRKIAAPVGGSQTHATIFHPAALRAFRTVFKVQ
ncbi:MAG TPA: hypothetical protein VFO19_16915 [Vicinamibacterales bacterium]|nr:hypothetical protein [Vicinamibacterales bacterium]